MDLAATDPLARSHALWRATDRPSRATTCPDRSRARRAGAPALVIAVPFAPSGDGSALDRRSLGKCSAFLGRGTSIAEGLHRAFLHPATGRSGPALPRTPGQRTGPTPRAHEYPLCARADRSYRALGYGGTKRPWGGFKTFGLQGHSRRSHHRATMHFSRLGRMQRSAPRQSWGSLCSARQPSTPGAAPVRRGRVATTNGQASPTSRDQPRRPRRRPTVSSSPPRMRAQLQRPAQHMRASRRRRARVHRIRFQPTHRSPPLRQAQS